MSGSPRRFARMASQQFAEGAIVRGLDPDDPEQMRDQPVIEISGTVFAPAERTQLSIRMDPQLKTPFAITLALWIDREVGAALHLGPRDARELGQSLIRAADEFDQINATTAAAIARAKGGLK